MAETSDRSYASGLVLGVALALFAAIVLFVIVLPRLQVGDGPDIEIEQTLPEAPDVPPAPDIDPPDVPPAPDIDPPDVPPAPEITPPTQPEGAGE